MFDLERMNKPIQTIQFIHKKNYSSIQTNTRVIWSCTKKKIKKQINVIVNTQSNGARNNGCSESSRQKGIDADDDDDDLTTTYTSCIDEWNLRTNQRDTEEHEDAW